MARRVGRTRRAHLAIRAARGVGPRVDRGAIEVRGADPRPDCRSRRPAHRGLRRRARARPDRARRRLHRRGRGGAAGALEPRRAGETGLASDRREPARAARAAAVAACRRHAGLRGGAGRDGRHRRLPHPSRDPGARRAADRSGRGGAAGGPAGARARAGPLRHRQPRQHGRPLPQRRRVRRRRRAARRHLLRSALPQGHPRLGRRRAEGPVREAEAGRGRVGDAGRGWVRAARPIAGRGRAVGARRAAGARGGVAGRRGAGLAAGYPGARPRRLGIPMAPGWDSLNVAAASAIVLHHLAGR